MSWIAVAIAGGAIVGAVGSTSAASTQAAGQQQAANTQLSMFNTINQQEQPFIQGGYGALNQLMYGLGIGGGSNTQQLPPGFGNFQTTPGGGTSTPGTGPGGSTFIPTPGG